MMVKRWVLCGLALSLIIPGMMQAYMTAGNYATWTGKVEAVLDKNAPTADDIKIARKNLENLERGVADNKSPDRTRYVQGLRSSFNAMVAGMPHAAPKPAATKHAGAPAAAPVPTPASVKARPSIPAALVKEVNNYRATIDAEIKAPAPIGESIQFIANEFGKITPAQPDDFNEIFITFNKVIIIAQTLSDVLKDFFKKFQDSMNTLKLEINALQPKINTLQLAINTLNSNLKAANPDVLISENTPSWKKGAQVLIDGLRKDITLVIDSFNSLANEILQAKEREEKAQQEKPVTVYILNLNRLGRAVIPMTRTSLIRELSGTGDFDATKHDLKVQGTNRPVADINDTIATYVLPTESIITFEIVPKADIKHSKETSEATGTTGATQPAAAPTVTPAPAAKPPVVTPEKSSNAPQPGTPEEDLGIGDIDLSPFGS